MNLLFKKIALVSILLIYAFSSKIVYAQDLKSGYYLTISAYAKNKESYAKAYVEHVKTLGHDAEYAFFPKENYFFVYLEYYDDFNLSIRELYKTRKNTEFDDCWIYELKQTGAMEKALNKEVDSLNDMFAERFGDKKDDSEENTEVVEPDSTKVGIEAIEVEKFGDKKDDSEENTEVVEPDSTKLDVEAIEAEEESLEKEEKEIAKENDSSENDEINGKHVFFSLFHGTTGKEVNGKVSIVDAVNNQLLKKYDGNKVNVLKNPENSNGSLILIGEAFGYKKVQNDFNYDNPIDEEQYPYVTNIGDTVVVNFELSRYTKGDIVTMYNVFFFKDAAIMRSVSKYEINELVNMLKENPDMEIKIHGHTNGNAYGKIISMAEGLNNYFSLSADNKNTIGSSKKLSQERADMVRRYLILKGIEADRIETKAWGGKAKLHHKLSSLAHKNVRVEIEVLKD